MTKETENLEKQKGKRLQWHPAFYASIQIELEEEADKLTFENEHHLSTKPLQIDVLIIRKNTDEAINKNIGQIFRTYNIVEYKSPTDYLSIDDFYMVYAYGCLYKALATGENKVKVEELTLTFVSEGYPKSMVEHLKENRGFTIEEKEKGIYYIYGDIIPIQLIVTSRLTEENNLWLKSLTDKLTDMESIERLSREYRKYRESKLYKSVMDIVMRANSESFEEGKDMCDALRELFRDELNNELGDMIGQIEEAEKRLRTSEEQLRTSEEQLRVSEEQLRVNEEQLRAKDLQIRELQAQLQMLKNQQA